MKLTTLLLLLPVFALAQKIKVSEYDKFIHQTRIEVEPVNLLSSDKANVSLALNSTGSSFYVVLSGYGWGVSTVDADQQVIFLFANDSTVSVRSIGLQTYDIGPAHSSYSHKYLVPAAAVELLSRYDLVGLRKYNTNDFSDMKITRDCATRVKKASGLFLDELKKTRVLQTLRPIDVKNIAQHVGDSVSFTCKVYGTRSFDDMDDAPTLLDINSSYGAPVVNIVIWKRDLARFNDNPGRMYRNKEVCIRGTVQLYNNQPQIVIHDRRQVSVSSPVALDDIGLYVGDSVTVEGNVADGRYFKETRTQPTLLNLGAPYPDQQLTVVIGNDERSRFRGEPEKDYVNKSIRVYGLVSLYKDKPQIELASPAQLQLVGGPSPMKGNKDEVMTASLRTTTASTLAPDAKAFFPGGPDSLSAYFRKQLKCPQTLNAGDSKSVSVIFSVGTDGRVSRIRILRSPGKIYDNEVIRVLKDMPHWQPELRKGAAVSSDITHQVVFKAVSEASF